MTRAHRWLAVLAGIALPLMLSTADASAARRHTARVATATYQPKVRLHAPHRLRASAPRNGRFAQMGNRALFTGS